MDSRKGPQKRTLQDRVSLAHARWFLSSAENQVSYSAVERQLKLLPKLDPNSDVLQKMPVGRSTVSAICSEALGPHFKELMCRKMRKAHVFTVGLDSSTVEINGLDKHLDIKIRFYDEDENEFRTCISSPSPCGKNRHKYSLKLS